MSIAAQIANDLGASEKRVIDLSNETDSHYAKYVINGRRIDEPSPELKLIQGWIAAYVMSASPTLPSYVTAYEPGSSIIKNARIHASNKHFVSFDIHGFFRSCGKRLVYDYFKSMVVFERAKGAKRSLTESECDTLVKLSCYRGSLPMGSPCSPILANRLFLDIDQELIDALPLNSSYSRYSDDICISSNDRLDCDDLESKISMILASHGFSLNPKKTRVQGRGSARRITGVYILEDGTLSLGIARKKEYSRALYRLLIHGEGNPREVLGKINFCKQVDPDYFVGLMAKYSSYGIAEECGGVLPAIYQLMHAE